MSDISTWGVDNHVLTGFEPNGYFSALYIDTMSLGYNFRYLHPIGEYYDRK